MHNFLVALQGRIQDSEKRGHNFVTVSMVIVCAKHTIWHAKHAKPRGVWGHAPPENFEKLNPLRLNLRAFLMAYCLYYFKTAHCTIIEIYLINISSKI